MCSIYCTHVGLLFAFFVCCMSIYDLALCHIFMLASISSSSRICLWVDVLLTIARWGGGGGCLNFDGQCVLLSRTWLFCVFFLLSVKKVACIADRLRGCPCNVLCDVTVCIHVSYTNCITVWSSLKLFRSLEAEGNLLHVRLIVNDMEEVWCKDNSFEMSLHSPLCLVYCLVSAWRLTWWWVA